MKNIKKGLKIIIIITLAGIIFVTARHFMHQDDERNALIKIE